MANAYSVELRERAVRASRRGDGTLADVAATFAVDVRTLERWMAHERATGSLVPKPKAGGWKCPITLSVLHAVIAEAPDATIAELCWEYNRRAAAAAQTTVTGFGHRRGWVTLGTAWRAMTAKRFLRWVRTALVPRLWPGAIVVRDNLAAHKQAAVAAAIRRVGARVKYLPPYSHDFNPIESAWALVKKHIKRCAPRTGAALRRAARRRAARRALPSLHALVRSYRVRRLKYFPGLIRPIVCASGRPGSDSGRYGDGPLLIRPIVRSGGSNAARNAGGAATTSGGSATTVSAMRGCVANAPMLRSRIVRPPMARNCFGVRPPSRLPCPPAATMATMASIVARCPLTVRPPAGGRRWWTARHSPLAVAAAPRDDRDRTIDGGRRRG